MVQYVWDKSYFAEISIFITKSKEFTVHRCFVINHIETAAVEFYYDKVGGFMPATSSATSIFL